jgi:ankyrin repeat protein
MRSDRFMSAASNRPQKQDQGKLDDDQKKTLMISLSFAQMDARQMTISTAHTETCTWLLETIQYRNWMDTTKMREHHGFLWLKGNAGTGKSTLMKFAWANVRSTMPDHIILSYFFNARGEDMEKSTTGTYQSLLLQLLERLPALQDVFNSLGISTSNINPSRQWDIESLKSMLQLAIKKLGSSSVVCFIDALDECEEAQIRDMVHFLERTSDMAMAGNINFRVCLSSRHYPHITMRHALELVLEQQYGHTQDIASYVKTELRIGSSSIAQQIRVELQEKASGIFLWVVLVVSILNKESDRGQVHALQQKLKEIPSDLHKLFRDVLTRDTLNKDALVLCIQWVLFAKQPLSPEQLHHAILSGIDPDGMAKIDCGNITEDVTRLFVLDSSKGLAEITVSENPTVQFIHESVRDFLLKTNDLDKILPDFSSNLQGQGNDRLKSCCLNYIKMVVASPSKCLHDRDNDHEDDEDLLYFPVSRVESLGKAARKPMPATQMAPFLEYSILNIFSHADSAEGSGISQADFLKVFPLLQWVKLYNTCLKKDKDRYAESVSLLYVLAEFDMPNLMTALGLIGQCIEVEDERYGCPLLAAVARHSESALRLCLDSIEVRQHCRDPDTAAVARRLIQHDVHHWSHLSHGFNYPNREGFLISAAEIDHEELFELLTISKNLDVDATDSHGRTALWLASGKGWYKAVSSLLDANPATVDVKDVYGEAPLYAATREGYKEVTELLLKRGANANTQGGRYGNALQAASALGHHQIAALLLNNGANINTQGGHYGNALQAASALGHRQLAALLLDNGASIYTQGGFYSDALQAASARGHHRTVALLINKGAIVNAQGGKYGNALQAASAGGHYQTAALLLDNGANINAQGGQHGNAIQAALFKKFAEVTELLLERGAIETPQWSHHPLVRHIRKRIPSSANPAPQPPQTLTNPLQTPVNALPPPTKQPF